jgi:hypothetical protein
MTNGMRLTLVPVQDIEYPSWVDCELLPATWQEIMKRAFAIIVAIMMGKHHYSPVRRVTSLRDGMPDAMSCTIDQKIIYGNQRHPFAGETLPFGYTVAGRLGISASIGDFIWLVLDNEIIEIETIPEFSIWGFPLKETPDHCMIIAEVTLHREYGDETFFCTGMTNFSGEGRSAMVDMIIVLNYWAAICGKTVQYKYSTWDVFQQFEDYINEH